MGKFGKKMVVKNGMENYMIGVMAPSGFGKSTLMYHICDKKFGDDGYIVFDVGSENGMSAIDGVVTERIPTWKHMKEVTDDIIKNKETEYPNLKVIILDTLDATFEIAEQYTVASYNREHMGEKNFRASTSINSVEGGFGRGLERVVSLVKTMIERLNSVGVGVWWTSHVKERDQVDLFTGASYTQLTASMTMKYFNSIKDISHLIGFGYYDRSIETVEVGDENPVTKKKKTRKDVLSENRKIKFRDDSLVADAKSRFPYIVEEIDLDTDEFIKAVEDAINSAGGKSVAAPAPTKVSAPAPVSELEDDDLDLDDETEEVEFDTPAHLKGIRDAFQAADTNVKKEVKAVLSTCGGKLCADIGVDNIMKIEEILGI